MQSSVATVNWKARDSNTSLRPREIRFGERNSTPVFVSWKGHDQKTRD